ncbi:hypothetical protein [Roseovarius salis]|uniref:hypothetical protein n=1 Tax=Roseovarius salis TaxID=3376063 RepID=UPI0037C5685C
MARLIMLVCLALAMIALTGLAVSATVRAARETRSLGREVALMARGTNVQKIAYAALMILMLGVTSGLLGGL